MDLMEEIKFPAKDSEWVKKVLIGGIILIIPFVNLIAFGYFLNVMKGSIDGKPSMPKWVHRDFLELSTDNRSDDTVVTPIVLPLNLVEEWFSFFIIGLKGLVISLIYLIIPIIITYLMLIVFGNVTGPAGVILIGLILALFLVFWFMIPMALSMYLRENKLVAALRFNEVISRIKSVLRDYLIVFVFVTVLIFVLEVLSFIFIFNFLIMPFVVFYICTAAYNMFGEMFTKSKA